MGVQLFSERWRRAIESYLIRTGRLRSRLPQGILLREIPETSPLHTAGMRPTIADEYTVDQFGDLIVGLNEERVRNATELLNALDRHQIGSEVEIHYLRSGRQQKAKIKLIEIQVRPRQ